MGLDDSTRGVGWKMVMRMMRNIWGFAGQVWVGWGGGFTWGSRLSNLLVARRLL